MWVCRFCETENQDSAEVCICCGHAKMVVRPVDNTSGRNPERKRVDPPSRKYSLLIIIAAVLGIAALCFFNVHYWIPATCTKPETCAICGKVRGAALGHVWIPATSTQPSRCAVCGEIGASSPKSTFTDSVAVPALGSVQNTSEGVELTWAPSTGAAKYQVLRRTGTDSWMKIAETASTSYVDSGAVVGTTYAYTLRGVGSNGTTVSSYDASGKTITYLTQVQVTSIQNTTGGVHLTWNASAGAEKYTIYRKIGNEAWTKLSSIGGTAFTDTSVASGITYTYAVRAVAAGTGTLSPLGNDIRSICFIATPVIRSITSTGDGTQLIWDACNGAAKYRVFRKDGSGNWTGIVDTDNSFFTDASAVNGATYTYTVRCISSDGAAYTSGYDEGGKTIKIVILDVPVIKTIQNAQGGVQLTWNAPAGAEKYFVLRRTENGAWAKMAETVNTSFTDAKVNSGTSYTYSVRCADASGTYYTSPFDSTGKTITYLAVINITALENVNGGVQVKWSALNGAAKYYVFRRTGNGAWTKTAETVKTSFIDAKVNDGMTYSYAVQCVGKDGKTVSYLDATGNSVTYLATVKITGLENDKGGVQVKWSASKGAAKYYVFRRIGNGAWTKMAETANTSFIDAKVNGGTAYTYTVRCVAEDGNSVSYLDTTGKTITYVPRQ